MSEQENLELSYLQSDKIGKVLAKGLANLYQEQPKFPVDYLAKWLLNYSSSLKNEQNLDEQQQTKTQLKQQFQEQVEQQKQQAEVQEKQQQDDLEIDEQFKQKIQQHEYHNELIVDEFPEFLEQRKKLTGCYIGNLDFSVKEVNDEDEDPQAHLNINDPKVINYIGYSQTQQQLMSGKILSLEQGVTGDVFKEKEVEEPNPDNPDEVPVAKPNYVYISDLVKEPRMNYFRLPKLGAYLALPLIYNSCLSENFFDSALEERQRYRIEKEEKEKEREQKELEFQENLKNLEENQEDTTELVAQYEAEKAEIADAVEAPFPTEKKEYVVCCDTMGQDQEISQETIDYLQNFTELFAKSWEERENELLSQDVDRQIQYLDSLQGKPAELVEQFNEQELQNSQDKEGNFAELKETNEEEYNFELECAKLEKVREHLLDKNNQEYFLNLSDFRVIKFPGIIQNILYLLGHRREEINLPNTHVLNWKLVRSKLMNEQFFEKVLNYNLRGAKPDQVPPYALVNRITEKLTKYDQEIVDQYNITFGRLLKWLRYTCTLRKQDIQIRRQKIANRKADRENKIAENERIKEEKERALEEKRAEIQTEEEKEAFDEAEWEKTYDEEHPLHEIPEEVVDEEDNDCEFLE